MPAASSSVRHATAFAAVLVAILLLACSGPVTPPPPPPPQPTPSTPAPEPRVRPKRSERERPALSLTDAVDLYDMGQEGENKYKGKLVQIHGKVDVQATKRPGPGGTSAVILQGGPGEPPYAIATIGHDSEALLFGSRWQPADVNLKGIYRERDARGTILLDNAQVISLTGWHRGYRPRRKAPEKPPEKPAAPIVVSAERLAQELHDDLTPAYKRYGLIPIQIQGVIHKQMENKGAIFMVQFLPAIKDRKTGKADDLTIFCGLRTPVPVKAKAAADLAVGKKVTFRGIMFAAGNGQATLRECELVRE